MNKQEEIKRGERERIIEYLRILQSHFTGMADTLRMDELISVVREKIDFNTCVNWKQDYRKSWQREKHNEERRQSYT